MATARPFTFCSQHNVSVADPLSPMFTVKGSAFNLSVYNILYNPLLAGIKPVEVLAHSLGTILCLVVHFSPGSSSHSPMCTGINVPSSRVSSLGLPLSPSRLPDSFAKTPASQTSWGAPIFQQLDSAKIQYFVQYKLTCCANKLQKGWRSMYPDTIVEKLIRTVRESSVTTIVYGNSTSLNQCFLPRYFTFSKRLVSFHICHPQLAAIG